VGASSVPSQRTNLGPARVARRPTHAPHGARCAPYAAAEAVVSPARRFPTDRGVRELRELARQGRLASTAAAARGDERLALTGAAYEVVWPIVFTRLTRRFEQRRGHPVCALGVDHLADECLDRFHDDVEAVVEDLLVHARQPVLNLEAWIAGRLTAATVNAHRRLRGQRGALQRPRLPGWLAAELGHDRWLGVLATEILVWVGVSATAGTGLWPLEAWAQRRGAFTGDWQHSDPAVVAREVEAVLAAMRRRPDWYESYVERPLGCKQAPVAAAPVGDGPGEVARPLALDDPHQRIDAELLRLAADAVRAIDQRVAQGEAAEAVVVEVIRAVFGQTVTVAGLDRAPHAAADPVGGLSGALADGATVNRIIATVLGIIGRPEATPSAESTRPAGDLGDERDGDTRPVVRLVLQGRRHVPVHGGAAQPVE
jgi:hypothetical protein